jgi:hypothetical protein
MVREVITFDPDSPWEVGDVVVFREGDTPIMRKQVVSVEHSEDGNETQYQFASAPDSLVRYMLQWPELFDQVPVNPALL